MSDDSYSSLIEAEANVRRARQADAGARYRQAVVPVTGTPGEGALYPELSPGRSGLTKTSYALIDHLRSIDKRPIRRVFGRVSDEELQALDQGLELFLGLSSAPWRRSL